MHTSPDSIARSIEISKEFDILGYPNGGYLASLATVILAEHVGHKDPLALNASFLGHPTSGAADIVATKLDEKKSLSRATLTLSQLGDKKAFYTAAFTDFERSTGLTHRFAPQPVAMTPYADCVPVAELAVDESLAPFLRRFDMRLARGCLVKPGPGQPAEVEGWIGLPGRASATLADLILFADAFPPPVFNAVHPSQWGSVPTVEYSVHLKAVPRTGPVHGRFWCTEVVRGFLEIDGELRDAAGDLVAVSRQVAKFRGGLGPVGAAHAG